MKYRRPRSLMFVTLLSLSHWLSAAAYVYASDVLVVCSANCSRHSAMIGGFSDNLKGQNPDVQLYEKSLADVKMYHDLLLGKRLPSLIFALDYQAATGVSALAGDIPIVLGMAAQKNDIRGLPNASGMVLAYEVKTQLEWMHLLVPSARRVGVLYHSSASRKLVEQAQQMASSLGLEIIAQEVKELKDLPGALKNVLREVDMLWGIPDTHIYSRQTAKAVLLAAFRQRIPMVGMSSGWVKAGALFALGWDHRDLGVQSGQLAHRILRGEPVRDIPPQGPRLISYSLNLKTAQHCKLDISENIIKGAAHVFE